MKKTTLLLCVVIYLPAFNCDKDNSTIWQELQIDQTSDLNCGCSSNQINEFNDYKINVVTTPDPVLLKQDQVNVIVFNKDSGTCTWLQKHSTMIGFSKICNYPLEIKNWNFNKDSKIKVKLNCNVFEPCTPIIGPAIYGYSVIILTKMYKAK